MKQRLFALILSSDLAICATTFPSNRQCQRLAHQPLELPTCSTSTAPDWDATWRDVPVCFPGTSRTYCVHTLPSYRSKHSLSIVGTPEAAQSVVKAREHAVQVTSAPEQNGYEVRAIAKKGQGVIAKRRMAKGEVIMLDSPAIIASAGLPAHVSPSQGAKLFENAVKMLHPRTRAKVMALDGGQGAGIDGVMEKNAFSCRFEDGTGDEYLCLFPEVSRINHACRPNANAKFSPRTLLMEIRALSDVEAGEEISISYGKIELNYAARQKLYSENWGFRCTCELCTAGVSEIARSDRQRERFEHLHEQLVSLTADTYDAQRVIAWEQEVFAISEEQGFEVSVTDDLERMAYVYAGLRNHVEALSWAQKALNSILQWKVGAGDSSDDLNRVTELVSQLSSH